MTTKKLASLFIAAGMLVGCGAKDEGDTTTSVGTTLTTSTTGSDESSDGGEGTSAGTSASTTATTADTSAEGPADSSGGGGCTPQDECMSDGDCAAGESCLPNCTCFGQGDSGGSSGGGVCPAGETCEMTGQGGMACLAESDHCVLFCSAMMACPTGQTCEGSVCHYDSTMLPSPDSDANYPSPDAMGMCPDPTAGPFAFVMGDFAMCSPPCDGMGPMAACPAAESGTAQGACLFNPTSSGDPC